MLLYVAWRRKSFNAYFTGINKHSSFDFCVVARPLSQPRTVTFNQGVAGSSPAGLTIIFKGLEMIWRPVSQAG
jgi:hypothetical protein